MSYHDDEIERREASLWKGVLLIKCEQGSYPKIKIGRRNR